MAEVRQIIEVCVPHQPLQATLLGLQSVLIQKKLWVSTYYDSGECGMVQIDPFTKKIIKTVKYPSVIQPEYHSICVYKDRYVCIVDGWHKSQIVLFDTFTNQYGIKLQMKPNTISRGSSCVVHNHELHIVSAHGHHIFDINTSKLEYDDKNKNMKCHIGGVHVYQNKLIVIDLCQHSCGYFDFDTKNWTTPDNWNEFHKNDQKTKRNVFGFCAYGEHCVTAGGYPENEDMYILDISSLENKWRKAQQVKCSRAGQYSVGLDHHIQIHFFSHVDNFPHYHTIADFNMNELN